MKVTNIICDNCSKHNAKEYKIFHDREMDASGNGYNNIYIYKDFCFECLQDYIKKNPDKKLLEK